MYFSKATESFYLPEIHGTAIPADAVEITSAEHQALLVGQSSGRIIAADADGRPVLVDPAPSGPSVPASITMRQCRLQLLATGKLGLVQPAIYSMPEPQRSAANIEWEYGAVVWRNSPLIAQLAPVLGWDTPEAIDQQFVAAGAL